MTTLLTGGTVQRMDGDPRTDEAIVVSDGRVKASGSAADMRSAAGADAQVIDLAGATVIPGLVDTHPHLMHFGALAEAPVDLSDATSHDEIVERLRARAAETPPGEWVMGTPVGEPHYFIRRSWRDLAEGALPGRDVLDRASQDHPIWIQAWAPVTPNVTAFNSAGLRQIGITADTPCQRRARVDRQGRRRRADRDPARLGQHLLQQRAVLGRDPRRAAAVHARAGGHGHDQGDGPLQRARRHDRLRGARDGDRRDQRLPHAARGRPADRPRARGARRRAVRVSVGAAR